jgi:Radical SAM superfamily.
MSDAEGGDAEVAPMDGADDPQGLDRVFCHLPWVHLCAHVDGVYARCCVDASAQQNWPQYQGSRPERLVLREDALGCMPGSPFAADNPDRVMDIGAAFNSPALRATRLAMLAGRPVPACRDCYQRERLAGDSLRLQMLRQGKRVPSVTECRDRTAPDGSVDGFPYYLDLRLGNHCNLRCVMCDVPTSSLLVRHHPDTWLPGSLDPYSTDPDFWRALEDNLWAIRSLYLAGGEPLLLRAHQRLLRLFVDRGRAPEVDLTYATNLTVLPRGVMDLWRQFRAVSLEASCDGVGPVFERVRLGGRWADFTRNVERVRDEVTVSIHASPQRDNVMDLGNIIDWALSQGLPVHVSNTVREPAELSIRNLPPEVKQQALGYLVPLTQRLDADGYANVARDVRGVTGYLMAPRTLAGT